MSLFRIGIIILEEAYFDEVPNRKGADVVRYLQRTDVPDISSAKDFHTLVVDLRRDSEAILAQVKKDTRYEIRRAQNKDNLSSEWICAPGEDETKDFCAFYDLFAKSRGLGKICRARISAYKSDGKLVLSRISTDNGVVLVWHAYYLTGTRARLLYSASAAGRGVSRDICTLAGRANRFLHWLDMLELRAAGFSTYDFGGWYEGTEDEAKLRINAFKEEFGGHHLCEKNWEEPISLLGRVFSLFMTILRCGNRMRGR